MVPGGGGEGGKRVWARQAYKRSRAAPRSTMTPNWERLKYGKRIMRGRKGEKARGEKGKRRKGEKGEKRIGQHPSWHFLLVWWEKVIK